MANKAGKHAARSHHNGMYSRVKLLEAHNAEMRASIHEMAASIRELIAELKDQTKTNMELLVVLDELGYDVMIDGVRVYVDSEAGSEGSGCVGAADEAAVHIRDRLRVVLGKHVGQAEIES